MSTRARDYAAAVLALEAAGMPAKKLAEGLVRTLTARGHTRLAGGVVRALTELTERQSRRSRVRLTLASESAAQQHATAIADARAVLGLAAQSHETRVDPRITGGFVLETAEMRHDASYRRALRTLYQKLTAA